MATELGTVIGGDIGIRLTIAPLRKAYSGFRQLSPAFQLALGALVVGGLLIKWRTPRYVKTTQVTREVFIEVAGAALRALGDARETRTQHPINHLVNRRPLALVDFAVLPAARRTPR